MRGHVLRGSHPRLISTAPAGLWGKGIREFLTFHIAAQKGKSENPVPSFAKPVLSTGEGGRGGTPRRGVMSIAGGVTPGS